MSAYGNTLNLHKLNGWDLVTTIKLLPRLERDDIIPHLPRLHWGGLSVVLSDPRMEGYKFKRSNVRT